MQAGQGDGVAGGVFATEECGWSVREARVVEEQAREFGAGVAADTGDSGAEGGTSR